MPNENESKPTSQENPAPTPQQPSQTVSYGTQPVRRSQDLPVRTTSYGTRVRRDSDEGGSNEK